jgi:hypothetical protein
MSRKRRLSDVSRSDTDDHQDELFGFIPSDTTTQTDETSLSSDGSSPTISVSRMGGGMKHRPKHAHVPTGHEERHAIKRRRKGTGHVKFQKSFEGMALDEQSPPMRQTSTPLENGSQSAWYPSTITSPTQQSHTGDSLDFRDGTTFLDAEGDIPIETDDDDVLRPQMVEQPSYDSNSGIRRESLEVDMKDANDGMNDPLRKSSGRNWYEPEKDREWMAAWILLGQLR